MDSLGPRLYDPPVEKRPGKGSREEKVMLTGSGMLSFPGLLGRGSAAFSSREIRKFRSAPVPYLYLYQYGLPRLLQKQPGPTAHALTWRLFEGRLGEAG